MGASSTMSAISGNVIPLSFSELRQLLVVVDFAVEDGFLSPSLVVRPSELFEEETGAVPVGLVPEILDPLGLHVPGVGPALSAGYDPVNLSGFQPFCQVDGAYEGLCGDEPNWGWYPCKHGESGRVFLSFHRGSESCCGGLLPIDWRKRDTGCLSGWPRDRFPVWSGWGPEAVSKRGWSVWPRIWPSGCSDFNRMVGTPPPWGVSSRSWSATLD